MNLKPIQQILETDVDRKEFLMYLGASLLVVVGLSGFAKSFMPEQKSANTKLNNKGNYNSSTYNG